MFRHGHFCEKDPLLSVPRGFGTVMLAARQGDGAKKATECRYQEQQQLKSAVHRNRGGEGASEETLPQGSSFGFSLGLTLIGEIGRELGPPCPSFFWTAVRVPVRHPQIPSRKCG